MCSVGDKRWQREWERKLTNLSWAVVPLGVAVTLATFALSVLTASPEERALDNYHLVVFLTGTAAFIELLSEPLYIFTLRFLLYRPRVVVEGTAAFLRCVATFLLVYFYPHLGAFSPLLSARTIAHALTDPHLRLNRCPRLLFLVVGVLVDDHAGLLLLFLLLHRYQQASAARGAQPPGERTRCSYGRHPNPTGRRQ
jgi:hypothetical protein